MTNKSTNKPTLEQSAAYQAMFDHFNRELFGGSLTCTILNFTRRTRVLGLFMPERWTDGGRIVHEISLNPAYLSERSPAETASTLVHEMVHAWQQEHGKPPKRAYHNAEWADKMEEIGLMPSDTAAPGGKRTGAKVSHYIIPGGPFERAFEGLPAQALPWICVESPERAERKERSNKSKTKYTCPCGTNIWGKPGLRAVCGECDEPFEAPEE